LRKSQEKTVDSNQSRQRVFQVFADFRDKKPSMSQKQLQALPKNATEHQPSSTSRAAGESSQNISFQASGEAGNLRHQKRNERYVRNQHGLARTPGPGSAARGSNAHPTAGPSEELMSRTPAADSSAAYRQNMQVEDS